jgi:hypothetical protein
MIRTYRKKPVVIQAVQFTGTNDAEVLAFTGDHAFDPRDNRPTIVVRALGGDVTAEVGDFIIKGVEGEFYPCKADVFSRTYEAAS